MDFKPIVTYTGACPLFRSLEAHIVASIPLDTCEFKRSYGRPVHPNIQLEATFHPLNVKLLEKYKSGNWSIIEHPVLHLYITECNDVDTYKSTVKEDVYHWLKMLNSYGIVDWMILVVETFDIKKTKNILTRTTVLDRIRTDFASKNGDRCISILNPLKYEMKATESYRCFLQRIRHLMLCGYNRTINKYEEFIRANRETRNQDGWCFIRYFLLQEELAFVLQMLGLHSEALIQYDELDAMFSQFILNSMFGEKPKWLEVFQRPFSSFHGITMSNHHLKEVRRKIEEKSITLLEFRSYLFERQAAVLEASDKTSEIAERLLPFLFSTLRELDALKIEMIDGALACWEFVCALEVLDVCETAIEADNSSNIFKYTAPIWNLAKDKLYAVGKLCGLLPGFTPTSEQLHIVVQLSAGMGDSYEETDRTLIIDNKTSEMLLERQRSASPNRKPKKSATERLKEALGSNQAFQKLYLELSELAISTYKHVSRLRSARLVGLDLGNFYCNLSEPNKAVTFFTDLMRELKAENWNNLASQTLLELANCYRKMDDVTSYTKICAAIACSMHLEPLVRRYYFDEFMKSIECVGGNTKLDVLDPDGSYNDCMVSLEDHFGVMDIQVTQTGPIIQDDIIMVQLKVVSNFPKEIQVNKIAISFETHSKKHEINLNDGINSAMLPVTAFLDYKQDNSINCASVVCDTKNMLPVRRSSSTRSKASPTVRKDFSNKVIAENVLLTPGENTVDLSAKATRVGLWSFKQLSICIDKLDFLSESLPIKGDPFEITTKAASATLNFKNLIAGIEQKIELIVSSGSFIFPKEATITLKCSKYLKLRQFDNPLIPGDQPIQQFKSEISLCLIDMKPFQEHKVDLAIMCDLLGQRDDKLIDQKITLQCPWSRNEMTIPLAFQLPMIASCRLHSSSGTRKFLQVMVKGLESELELSNIAMNCDCTGVTLHNNNPKTVATYKCQKNSILSFLWELQVEPLQAECQLTLIKVHFSLDYAHINDGITFPLRKHYYCKFDVTDYIELFRIELTKLEPGELCRVGTLYNLNLKIIKMHASPYHDLMYEVIGENLWAVVGRTTGVISMLDHDAQSVMIEVLPLCAGFLPLPNIRLSKYISAEKDEIHPILQPFPPGQVYNATKSLQIHVLATANNNHGNDQ